VSCDRGGVWLVRIRFEQGFQTFDTSGAQFAVVVVDGEGAVVLVFCVMSVRYIRRGYGAKDAIAGMTYTSEWYSCHPKLCRGESQKQPHRFSVPGTSETKSALGPHERLHARL